MVTEGAHEALIGEELYKRAAQIREKISARTAAYKHPTKGYPIEENIFDNVLYCGVCGRKMTRSSYVKQYADGEKARLDGYFCLNGGQTKVTVCPETNRISKNQLLDILLPLIRVEFDVFLNKPKRYMEYGKKQIAGKIKEVETKIRDTEEKIRRFREEEGCVYMNYRAGKMLQKDYVSFKLKQEDRLKELQRQLQEWEKERKALDKLEANYLKAIKALLKLKSGKDLTKDMVEAFVSKIYIYPGKRIEVLFSFTSYNMEGVK